MSNTTKPAAKAPWQKPTVQSVTSIKKTRGGPITGAATEEPFYTPS